MRWACILIVLAASNSLGGKEDKAAASQAQAVVLDHNEFACDNCLFGMNDYYYCFQAGEKILIGHDKVRTQMRHQNPSLFIETGKSMPVRYDEQYIWVSPAGAKEIKLKQDYTTRIFTNNSKCQAATK
jgi:hypothetical protein